MIIIGVDFHPEFQQITLIDTDSGELEERRLHHPDEAEAFYRGVVSQGKTVRVGMEASGHARWFETLSRRITDRAVDWRCSRDPNQACTPAEDRGSPSLHTRH